MTSNVGTGNRAGAWHDRLLQALVASLLAPRSVVYEIVFGTAAVAVATVLRFVLDDVLPPGFPFLTFFPAVMLTLVFSSLRSGIAVAVVSGLIAWYFFIAPVHSFATTPGAALALSFYAVIVGTDVLFLGATVRAMERRQKAEARANRLAHARSLMFSELQHRISNNLATVAALLRMQSHHVADEAAKQALVASQNRIRSISLLQRRLHAPDMQGVDAADYLREVLHDVVEISGEEKIALGLRLDSLGLSHEVAMPLGLVASELVMNAIEHGRSEDGTIAIEVTLTAQASAQASSRNGRIAAVLTIRDHGPGLPPGFDLAASDSLGLIVARQFAESLGGDLSLTCAARGGAVARLRFAVDPVRMPQSPTPAPPAPSSAWAFSMPGATATPAQAGPPVTAQANGPTGL